MKVKSISKHPSNRMATAEITKPKTTQPWAVPD